jgi:hypothetical protein
MFDSEGTDMTYLLTQITSSKAIPIVSAILGIAFLASCTYGPPKIRAHITNVKAKPDSHLIAVAVEYEEFREATGINTFPSDGTPKVLDQKAKIYLCNAETLEVTRVAFVTPKNTVRIGWQPWIIGWHGDSLFFQISGQKGTAVSDSKTITITYRIDPLGQVLESTAAPGNVVFQANSGPLPQGKFVRISKGYDTIDVRTEGTRSLRTLFRIDAKRAELVAVKESNK